MICKYCKEDIRLENGLWLDSSTRPSGKSTNLSFWQKICTCNENVDDFHSPDKEYSISKLLSKLDQNERSSQR